MVLDKSSIEELLCKNTREYEALLEERRKGIYRDGIYIRTDTEVDYFDKESQIGNDGIDLRISNYGYIMSSDYEYLNTLSNENINTYYEKVDLPETGYLLNPGALLFVPTYERIALCGDLIGRITGRSVFARMGLSVHCTQDKFSSGINSVVGLQVVNNSPIPLLIFPYQKLAQLLIEKTGKNRYPYTGTYCQEVTYTLPTVKKTDLKQYSEGTQERISQKRPKKIHSRKAKKSPLVIIIANVVISSLVTVLMGVFGITQNIEALVSIGILGIVVQVFWAVIEHKWIEDKDD